jgi:hypothetical protein
MSDILPPIHNKIGESAQTQNAILAPQEQKLAQILANSSLIKEFRTFSEIGCITENIDFLLDLEQFKGTITRLAIGMMRLYFGSDAEKPLNVRGKVCHKLS